ncbi:NAD(P)-binding domain-containing protein [Alsobacter sp. SYSU M60028]|uniref:2-dehydropantoate 2-reductase n=1 Tax=Alsobacter ponti TaxID=2962936 RepID=A0ABT1LD52_9HYPH|nr:2-dehydropantoate 2-reductase N-terminal domain-containing protein [Alsobacter ponti]MCP8939427.1 NAD(P)-binding domain-containing protein [Alsobacter ponti]
MAEAVSGDLPELGQILVWGAGAIGATLGGAWVRAGRDVLFVDADPDHVAALNRDGLTIEGPVEQYTIPVRAVTPENVKGVWTCIVLAVKAHHTEAAARALAPHLAADGFVLSAQNGLNEITIAKIVGEARTMGCFVNYGADYLGPGRIIRGNRGAVVVGEVDGRVTPRVRAAHRLLLEFEPDAVLTTDIWSYLWGKLGYGALLFGTALTNESIADALASPRHRPVWLTLGREVMAVAAAKGVKPTGFNGFEPAAFAPGAPPELLDRALDEMVTFNRGSAKSHSGIWRDLAVRKRRTEIDDQIGIIGRIGREVGVATPALDRLVTLIHDIEEGRRPLDWATLDEMLPASSAALA